MGMGGLNSMTFLLSVGLSLMERKQCEKLGGTSGWLLYHSISVWRVELRSKSKGFSWNSSIVLDDWLDC